MSKIGTCVKITLETKELVGELSTSLATAVNLIEVSSKASKRESNFEYGRIANTLSVNSIGETDGTVTTETWKDLHDAAVAGTKVAVEITNYAADGTTKVIGDVNIAGTALIGNLTEDYPDNDRITYSCDLTFDGAITKTVNA
jgi:hypothetical protein